MRNKPEDFYCIAKINGPVLGVGHCWHSTYEDAVRRTGGAGILGPKFETVPLLVAEPGDAVYVRCTTTLYNKVRRDGETTDYTIEAGEADFDEDEANVDYSCRWNNPLE